jgi:hypothetical protein
MGFEYRIVERQHFRQVQYQDQPVADVRHPFEVAPAQPGERGVGRLDGSGIDRYELTRRVDEPDGAAVALTTSRRVAGSTGIGFSRTARAGSAPARPGQ